MSNDKKPSKAGLKSFLIDTITAMTVITVMSIGARATDYIQMDPEYHNTIWFFFGGMAIMILHLIKGNRL